MKNKKNAGFSLVEIIVVIAIMAVLVGMTSVGISLMFSRDAEKCATEIEGGLDKLRAYSMSKKGKWYMEIKQEVSDNNIYMTIYRDEGSGYEIFEQENLGSRASLISGYITIEFNKANGSVSKVNGSAPGDITQIKLEANRTNKSETVNLVTLTGRHFLEE